MSVVGLGTDLVAVERITRLLERHGGRFRDRCFRLEGEDVPDDPGSLAARWAAKEAFLKALGADVRGIPYRDIEVIGSGREPRRLILHGLAQAALASVGGNRLHLAVSLNGGYAVASVLIED